MNKPHQQISGLKAQVVGLKLHLTSMSPPAQLQSIVLCSVLIWSAFSVSALTWALWPSTKISPMPSSVVNPPTFVAARPGASNVVLDDMLNLGLFGVSVDEGDIEALDLQPSTVPDGIEKGARDTQLDLQLVGTLAGNEPDAGTAVIEVKGRQVTFSVGDELPIGTRVRLAKVLPTRVVLDNNGTYELLELFEDSASLFVPNEKPGPAAADRQPNVTNTQAVPVKALGTSELGPKIAAEYRRKFYERPQSVSDLLTVQPVHGEEGLRGYRVTPAKNIDDFKAIGFEPNDVIVGVNGLSLLDASNGARLYGLMRDAQEIIFDIERGSVPLTLTVSLSAGAQQ